MNSEISKDIEYNPTTGQFIWIRPTGSRVKAGSIAGTINKKGYRVIYHNGEKIKASRLAWFMIHGETPKIIDHINGVKSDDRIENLRAADNCSNQWNVGTRGNNSCGAKNIYFDRLRKSEKKYSASFYRRGVRIYCGYFKTLDDAVLEASRLREIHHGEFANHGQFMKKSK